MRHKPENYWDDTSTSYHYKIFIFMFDVHVSINQEPIVTASHSARGLVNPVPVYLSSSTGEVRLPDNNVSSFVSIIFRDQLHIHTPILI